MVAAIRRGDRVVTSGGLMGTISKVVNDTEVMLEVAEGVKVRVLRGSITDIVSKSEPVKDSGESENGKD